MSSRARHASALLLAVGVAGVILAIPASWPGRDTWQPQAETFSSADGLGQSLLLEFDHPAEIRFPISLRKTSSGASPKVQAQVTVVSSPMAVYRGIAGRIDPTGSILSIPLAVVRAGAGTEIVVELSDPGGEVAIGSTEHDSYSAGSRELAGILAGGDVAFQVFYRRSLGSICLQGLAMAAQYWRLLLAFGAAVAASGLLVSGALRRTSHLDLAANLSFALGGGLLATAQCALAAAVLRIQLTPLIDGLALGAMALAGVWLWLKSDAALARFDTAAIGLVVLVAVFGALRLAFASNLALPPHIDSVAHYLLVSDLLTPAGPTVAANTIADLFTKYYHLGFHGLAAWIFSLSRDFDPLALVVLGQLIQACAIGAVYFLVYAAVGDTRAALLAVVLAGIGWTMPGYASNWAKYPALLGLATFPALAGLSILALRATGRRQIVLLVTSGLAAGAEALIHTRMLFLYAAFLAAVGVAHTIETLPARRVGPARWMVITGFAALILLVAFTSGPYPLQPSIGKFVESEGGLSSLLVLALAPIGLQRFPKPAMVALSSSAFILLFQLLPLHASYPFPILDAPIVSMVLYLPLACLGGMAFARLFDLIRSWQPRPRSALLWSVGLAGLGVVYIGWCLAVQPHAPGDCCVLARADDVTMARRAAATLPTNARVLIASQAEPGAGPLAVDGGAWLFALTRLQTVLWPARSDLTSATGHASLCAAGITEVYVGGTPWGFSRQALDLAPFLYQAESILPGAAIYRVVGCHALH